MIVRQKKCYMCGKKLKKDAKSIRVMESPKDSISVKVCPKCYEEAERLRYKFY